MKDAKQKKNENPEIITWKLFGGGRLAKSSKAASGNGNIPPGATLGPTAEMNRYK